MICDVVITVKAFEEKNEKLKHRLILEELDKKNIRYSEEELTCVFQKKSIDARRREIKLHLRYKIYIGEKPAEFKDTIPEWKKADSGKQVIIVGAGPAGLFGALKLLEYGIKPILLERGTETSQRKRDIAKISTQFNVNENSNYCFGEGGAGTFSDGKLYTRSNKRGDISSILRIFAYFGADKKILTDAHPHIGTDKLPQVINRMREKIIELGGEFYFNTKVTDLILENNPDGKKNITGVKTINISSGEEKNFYADAVLLATGHSASDIYMMLAKNVPSCLEAKTFAAGVRVEHPRELIDSIQYHGKQNNLGAAEYRVTAQADGRGVYSFCMCPGGFVVPSSSGPDEIVVNGMSAAARNSKWSNAAIVVEIRPEDIPEKFVKEAEKSGCVQIAGLLFRTVIEQLAKQNGNGQAAPSQRLTDFLKNRKSEDLPETSYTPGIVSSNLNEWLPEHITKRLHTGFNEINRSMKGFICSSALMIAAETRTSTPVRIVRDKESCECNEVKNLFPAGEGSGYSGGIVSSAMDGEKACVQIAKKLFS